MAPRIVRRIPVSPRALAIVRKAMRDVVASPRGTAHLALANLPMQVAGKTGTAQVVSEVDDGSPARRRHRDHAWFMGFAPFDDPRIAFAVLVEHGGHGGSAAAPVAAAIVRALKAEAGS